MAQFSMEIMRLTGSVPRGNQHPIANAVLWSVAPSIQVEMGIDVATFLGIFTIYTGFYMGGNTILRGLKK